MSQWGVFHDDERWIHIAPVLPDGRLAPTHALHEFCRCGPKQEMVEGGTYLWVHQDPEAGGYNS